MQKDKKGETYEEAQILVSPSSLNEARGAPLPEEYTPLRGLCR